MNCESITLSKYLARYLNLSGPELKKLTHNDVKVLFPQIERCSFDHIEKHPELIAEGCVVLVSDGKHTIPYKVSSLDCMIKESITLNREEIPKLIVKERFYNYSDMSIYELKCLLTRKFNATKNRREAQKELEKRGVVLHKKYVRNSNNINTNKMEE
ncbi:MAG: hypothetical protein GX758_03870 [Tenericutes bacterium]|nr:hypothetical protein [Mycoplasmatota bacterium]